MARIPDAFIDDLLARTDIVEVVGTRVPLKSGRREALPGSARQLNRYALPGPVHGPKL